MKFMSNGMVMVKTTGILYCLLKNTVLGLI